MKLKCLVLLVALFIVSSLPLTAAAAPQLDSVLGIPWGASPDQARKNMTDNGYLFVWEGADAGTGSRILEFKGSYAAFPAYFQLFFMNRQLWQLSVRISDEEYNMNYAFSTVNKLLGEKYGPMEASKTYNYYRNIPITIHTWKLDGNTKVINLRKIATFYIDKTKMNGGVFVYYENVQLFEKLKKSNI